MTPTLIGRWQTRLLLLTIVGIPITVPFALGLIGTAAGQYYFYVVGYVALLGMGWDILYQYLQSFRWDHDWPSILQLLAGIWEALVLITLARTIGLPGIPAPLSLAQFMLHYGTVWLAVYVASQSLMRILFPHWRFWGGQLWK